MRSSALLVGLLLLAFSTAACDAAGGVRLRAEAAEAWSGRPAAQVEIAAFWFDLDEDDPFGAPLDDSVAKAAEARGGRPGSGITQRKWTRTRTDAGGRTQLHLETFYAGALTLPLRRLAWGAREADPTGLWIRVTPPPEEDGAPQDFLVLEREGTPVPIRMLGRGDRFEEGGPGGKIEVLDEGGWTWDLRVEILPSERR